MRTSNSEYFNTLPNLDDPIMQLEWNPKKSPLILIRNVKTKKQLLKELISFKDQHWLKRRKGYGDFFSLNISNVWKIVTIVILPLFWVLVSYQILIQLITQIYSQFVFLTFLFLLIVSLTFAGPLLYVISKRVHERHDEIEQLNLLDAIIANSTEKSKEEILEDILYFEKDGIKWKRYQSNWDLSIFYPEFSIIDIVGFFSSLFALIYLFTWFVKVLGILTISTNKTSFREALLYLDLLLVLIFLGFIAIGFWYGINCNWSIKWNEPWINKPILGSTLLLIIGITGTFIIEIITDQFTGTFVFFILMFEVPLISSFVINRIRLFVEFNRVRLNLIRIITKDTIETGEKLKNIEMSKVDQLKIRDLFNRTTFTSLINKTPVPSSRIRSYLFLITAIFSLITTIIAAFIGSTDLFTQIINSVFR